MFTQACFIMKNTPELRSKLKDLGYKCNNGKWMGTYLATFKRGNSHDLFYCGTPKYDLPNNPSLNNSIACGTNENLFLALTALRDDEDYMQFFTDGKDFILCDRQDWIDMYSTLCSGGKYTTDELDKFHKATVEELIEHFKQK